MKSVEYMSRGNFEATEFEFETAIISIGDPGSSMPIKCNGFSNVLRLEFLDIDLLSQKKNAVELFVFQCKELGVLKKYFDKSFAASDANEVCKFVQRNIKNNIVVHCDYGKSRSVAIAKHIGSNGHVLIETNGQKQDGRMGNKWVTHLLTRCVAE